ncbi:MAG: hypothetical protein KME12_03320 [Trichocoleus desertorum ATA4-8-CV12]|jgi:hypothetical protein|nr:hypothetical protein [Trichocoleus desertorum ATA4-8-CV12]
MVQTLPPIYFYIPCQDFPPDGLPKNMAEYWQWKFSVSEKYRSGKYDWVLQTFLYLQEAGFPCQLIQHLPEEGILVSHRDFLAFDLQPQPKVLMVCIQADRPNHPYAQLHIVQNSQDPKQQQLSNFWESYYIPLWIQPSLKPRCSERGDRIENVAYYGIKYNLAAELKDPAWQEQLQALGLNWQIVRPEQWHDYSNVDVLIGVRSFEYDGQYLWKPPSKLLNAWHAGVPAVLGCESAFRAQRQSDLDYLEVHSPKDTLSALKRLQNEPELRRAMIEHGKTRAKDSQPAKMVERWCNFLINTATPAYYRWVNANPWGQQTFLKRRYLLIKTQGLQRRLRSLVSPISENGNWN